jgi:hypothetical protein
MPGVSVKETLTPSRLRRSFPLPRAGEGRVRALSLKNVAKGAGAVVIGLIALDLVATAITLAVGAEFLKR